MTMDRDQKSDRANQLFEEIKPELLKVLKAAPEFGSCGLDIILHEGAITRIIYRTEMARKLRPGGRL
jgi:hypothetical protein